MAMQRRQLHDFEIVALGCSMGGLRALQLILGQLPGDFPRPMLIVQHRSAEVDSRLPELLQRKSKLVVVEPNDKQKIEAGQVYLAPAGYHMLADSGSIALSTEPPVLFARPSIDVLFESVADVYGARSIAVVLTGASEDGAAGAAMIHAAGGAVVVEDPSSAESPVLPRATIARFAPEAIVPLSGVAATVMRWCGTPSVRESVEPRRS